MDYKQARNLIRSGDLIAVRKRGDLWAALTRWFTRSPYTHTALAVWSGAGDTWRLLVAEEKASGCFLTPLSQYEDVDFDVFIAPDEVQERIEEVIYDTLGAPIAYDYADWLRIGLNRLLGWPLPPENALLICSALSATLWLKAGWKPLDLPTIPAPDDVVRALGQPARLKVRPYA